MSLKFIRQENSGPASARNTGASQAIGEFLAFTDDDCMPAQNWLSELEHSLLSAPGCMVGGRVVNGLSENIYAQASQIVLDIVYAYYNSEGANPHFFAANNMAVPASVFRSVGGFDVSYYYPQTGGEDRDFCDRWLGFGHGMVYASRAIVNHYHDLTLSTFWKQHMAYGRGAFRFNRSHARRDQKNSTIRLDFYISLFRLFSNTTSGLTKNITSRLLFLMVIWQAANSMGFFLEMIEYLIKRQRTM
jgi:GT2 family glycosyltransferase